MGVCVEAIIYLSFFIHLFIYFRHSKPENIMARGFGDDGNRHTSPCRLSEIILHVITLARRHQLRRHYSLDARCLRDGFHPPLLLLKITAFNQVLRSMSQLFETSTFPSNSSIYWTTFPLSPLPSRRASGLDAY